MPSPAVARELVITYAGLTLGGTSPYYLLDASREGWKVTGDNFQSRVTADVTVVSPLNTEAEFVAKCQALEAAFRTLNGEIVVTQGAVKWLDFGAADNEGFLARPKFTPIEDKLKNTGRSRAYSIEVVVNRRANFYDGDGSGRAGLQSAEIAISVAATGQRALSISGTYTAQSGATSSAQYLAQIGTYLGAITGGFAGSTWENTVQEYRYDDQNKLVKFRATARHLLYRQVLGGIDDPAIKNDVLLIEVSRPAPGDLSDATRPADVTVFYDADLDSTVTTDPMGTYTSKILPLILSQVRTSTAASVIALMKSAPKADFPRNRISATLQIQAVIGGAILMHARRAKYSTNYGKVIMAVFDGNPWAKEVFDGPGRRLRVTTEDFLTLGGTSGTGGASGGASGVISVGNESQDGTALGNFVDGAPTNETADPFGGNGGNALGATGVNAPNGGQGSGDAAIAAASASPGAASSGWIKIADDVTSDPKVVGLIEAQFPVVLQSIVTTEEYVEAPSSSASADTGGVTYTSLGGAGGGAPSATDGGSPPSDGSSDLYGGDVGSIDSFGATDVGGHADVSVSGGS